MKALLIFAGSLSCRRKLPVTCPLKFMTMSGVRCSNPCRGICQFAPAQGGARAVALAALCCLAASGCASVPNGNLQDLLEPSNHRDWKPNMAALPYARFRDDRVKVYNIRNCTYIDEDTYVLNYEDRTYSLSDLETVDFIVCPFKGQPSLAHTMLSFGFRDGQYLAVSVEVRLEKGESYSAVGGMLRQFEIMYVVADERDVIRLRTEVRDADVYVYRLRAAPTMARNLFVDVMRRVNTLKRRPEFYDTLMNNCTTNLVAHLNRAQPGFFPLDSFSILSGYSDLAAYSLGALVDYGSFQETRRRAHVNALARAFADSPHFSQKIRAQDGTTQLVQEDKSPLRR